MNKFRMGLICMVVGFVVMVILELWCEMIHDLSIFLKDKYAKWKEDMRNDPIAFWKAGKPCAAGGCAISASGRSTPCPTEQNTAPGFVDEIKFLHEDDTLLLNTGIAVNPICLIMPSLAGGDTLLSGVNCNSGESQDFLLTDIAEVKQNGKWRVCAFDTKSNRLMCL